MANVDSMTCCGVDELSGISRQAPEGTILDLLRDGGEGFETDHDILKGDKRFTIFTQATKRRGGPRGYGERLSKYIVDSGMGSVVGIGGDVKNPNSGNYLKVFVWTMDWAGVLAWLKKDLKNRYELIIDPDSNGYDDRFWWRIDN